VFNDITIYFIKKKWMSVKILLCPLREGFNKLDFENNTIEYVPKTTNNNAGILFYYVSKVLVRKTTINCIIKTSGGR
jgi:hypothetical protein